MKKKFLISLDLDGTTLKNDGFTIPKKNIEVIKKMQSLGHKVIIISGRPPRAIEKIYRMLGLKSLVSSYNGAFIYHPYGKETYKSFQIPNVVFQKIINNPFIRKYNKAILAECEDLPYLNTSSNLIFVNCWLEFASAIKIGDLKKCQRDPNAIFIETLPHIEYEKYFVALKKFGDFVSFNVWKNVGINSVIIHVYPKKINKNIACSVVADYYKIPQSNVIAFGDENNDYEILKWAGIGVKMKNGNINLKKVCKYETDSSNEDAGVGLMLEKIINHSN
ncbi:Cof-type HAD-IIB family hydrolase [symbiont of Argiope bruennichi]|uniref:Cof-type HAD-IIB family hydrolase n=1 Tax=symbiont of Argiope bruennichi TaxID=2810479 RepID=UPI003DA3FBC1